ncbi:MAG: glutathione synthase [Pseudomonadota bacterium]
MPVTLGVVMDPIGTIKPYKDSTFAMLLAARARGWSIHYMEPGDLYVRDGVARAGWQQVELRDNRDDWHTLSPGGDLALGDLDIILMRQDPPITNAFLYVTHILELARQAGALVVNRPDSVRDANEKLFAAWFPQCMVPTLVSSDGQRLRGFIDEHRDVIVKPLDAMGGAGVFRLAADGPNIGATLEILTGNGELHVMAQRYIPEIRDGDKRILMIDGEPVPYALARIPQGGEVRGNLAAGGRGEGRALTARDRWICAQVGPKLREMGLIFVGLDVIGDYLTEINVTSPTCIRELDAAYGIDIAGQLLDHLVTRLAPAGTRPG